MRDLGCRLWRLAESQQGWRSRLAELARRDSKVATALQSALFLRGKLVADIVGRDHLAVTWCRFNDTGDRWDQWAQQAVISATTHREIFTDVGRLRFALGHTWQQRTPADVFARVKRLADPDGVLPPADTAD